MSTPHEGLALLSRRAGRAALAALRRHVGQPLLEFALPQRCACCGAAVDATSVLCAACLARIPRLPAPLCVRCLGRGDSPYGCLRHPQALVFSAWVYDDAVAPLVHALKYEGRPQLARALGAVLATAIPTPWQRADLLLEVPLHPARERERGYNQAGALADALARTIAVPRLAGQLRRTRATAPQARLGQQARRQNVAGAFAVHRPEWLAGRRVLVVDDVLTTGSTMQVCLAALVEAGAKAAGVTLAFAQ